MKSKRQTWATDPEDSCHHYCFIKWGKMSFCPYEGSYPGLSVCSSAH